MVPLVYRGGGCNSYTRIWGHFEPFWGRFWGLIKHTIFDTINSIAISTTRTYFASPRDSVSDAFYVIFARALCFFQNRDTIFIASFFIFNNQVSFVGFHSSDDTHLLRSINSFFCLLETLFGPALPLYYPAKRSGILSFIFIYSFFLLICFFFILLLIPRTSGQCT